MSKKKNKVGIARLNRDMIGRVVNSSTQKKELSINPKSFKTNLDKHFIACARTNNLWNGLVEFKKSTEHNRAFANSAKNPQTRKTINKIILKAFSKIDSSITHYKYHSAMSKLEKRYESGQNLFSNSFISVSSEKFMDNVMQDIVATDILSLDKSDREIIKELFSIFYNPAYKNENDKYDAINKLSHDVLPEGDMSSGKFKSASAAKSFLRFTELCKQLINYDNNLIASVGAHNPSLSFNESLKIFRDDLKINIVPILEVANMYHRALGVKPINISKFIRNQEAQFISNEKLIHPNDKLDYTAPTILPDSIYEEPAVIRKNFISKGLKKLIEKLGGIKRFFQKLKLNFSFRINRSKVKPKEMENIKLKISGPVKQEKIDLSDIKI